MNNKDKSHHANCLFKVPIFRHLNEKEKAGITELINVRKLKKGDAIYNAGEKSSFLYIVHQGSVKVSRYNEDGMEQVVRVLNSGDFAGEKSLFTNTIADDYAISLEDSMVCVLDGNQLKQHMMDKPEISFQIISELTNRLSDTENKLEKHNLTSVEKRIANSIIELSNGRKYFKLPISKLDWASMLGTTSETLSRRLRDFKDKGIIELSGQRDIKIINFNKLEEI